MKYNDYLMADELNLTDIAKNFAEKIAKEQEKDDNPIEEFSPAQSIALDIIDGLALQDFTCKELKKFDAGFYNRYLIDEEKTNEQLKQKLIKTYFDGEAKLRELEDRTFENSLDAKSFLQLMLIGLSLNCVALFKENKTSEEMLDFATAKLELLRQIV